MKHPALTRVFAIVLAIMCAVMLLAGVSGVRTAFSDRAEENSARELMLSRIESARALEEILKNTDSYDQQSSSFDESKAQHEEDSAQHRTDLATYSATRGGTKMGADKLWEAKAQTESGREKLEAGLKQINDGLTQVETAENALSTLKPYADNLSATCGTYAGECGAALDIISAGVADAAAAAADPSADPTTLQATIDAILDTAETEATAAMLSAPAYNPTINGCVTVLSQLAAASGGSVTVPTIPAVDVAVDLSNEQNIQDTMTRIGTAKAVFENLSGAVMTPWTQLAATRAQLETAKTTAEDAMAKLEAGEGEIQWNLEQIWYQNGELEKDAAELEEKKTTLEQEAKELAEQERIVKERQENEKKYTSLSILLKANDNVSDAVDAGEDMLTAAEQETARLKTESEKTFVFRLIICILSIVAAICGFAVIPAAFERWKSRISLLLPAVLCFAFSAAALALNFYIGRGVIYSVLFVLPFALFYLLSAAPQEKVRE